MNRMPRLSKSGIEYLDYVWNFYSGCENHERGICPVPNCWARGTVNRFKAHYPNGFDPTYYPEAFLSPLHLKKPSRIGMAFMGDLFGDWVDLEQVVEVPLQSPGIPVWGNMTLRNVVRSVMRECPQHTFLTLTKCPWNLPKWSPFPDNCWVGVTITEPFPENTPLAYLSKVEATVKYISFEPLLKWSDGITNQLVESLKKADISWVIIGTLTCSGGELATTNARFPQLSPMPYGNKYVLAPQIEWVEEIMRACAKAGVPVFLKDNLLPLIIDQPRIPRWSSDKTGLGLRQEMLG